MTENKVFNLIEVKDNQLGEVFIKLAPPLYKNDPNYIRPLDNDIKDVFNPLRNNFYTHGNCIRWVLFDGKKPIGRIAAFYNTEIAYKEKQPTGGCGFFECINNQQAANILFDAAKKWLQSNGMEAMDGPVNFGDRDKWWGLLVDGFLPPTYTMNYNPPYYKELFENYGFKLYFKQFVFHRDARKPPSNRMLQKASLTLENPDYSFRQFDPKRADKFIKDFNIIYNNTWTKFLNAPYMSLEQSFSIFKRMKPILVNDLLWFGYYKEKPVSFFLMIPDINQIIKDFNGRLTVINKIKFLYRKMVGVRKIIGVIFGVDPDHHSKGIDQGMMVSFGQTIQKHNFYMDLEMNWVGDFNPRMINMTRNIEAHILKTYITYRLLFDPHQPFERHPIV